MENLERLKALCDKAAVEQDPDKLLALVAEINDMLEERERGLRIARQPLSPN